MSFSYSGDSCHCPSIKIDWTCVLILFSGFSVIQFCSTAFAYYAQATAAGEIFGHTLQSLRGIKYLYKSVTWTLIIQCCSSFTIAYLSVVSTCRYNVFQIGFIALAILTFIYYSAFVSFWIFPHLLAQMENKKYIGGGAGGRGCIPFNLLRGFSWTLYFVMLRVGEERSRLAGYNFPLDQCSDIKGAT